MNRYSIKYLQITLIFILFSSVVVAQSPSVKTFVDRSDILIGEQVKYKVVATFTTGAFKTNWFATPDSVAHFEIVDRSKIDTTIADNITTLEQTITLTSFDSGRWNTPAFSINFNPVKDDTAISVFTDSMTINVGYTATDTSSQLRDIKPIMNVTVENYLWYYIGGGILLLLIAGFFIWWYFKNKKKAPLPAFSSKISPYDEAMQQLEQLKQLNLQNADTIKQYHTGIAEIFKRYISRKQNVSVMNKTTGDILVHLADNKLPADIISAVATALRCGDAVKFAKYLPAAAESEECITKIKEAISFIQSPKPQNP
ncbi:hypothetical protein [Ferruginibacter sp.]|nr:hypothetical protein [Ferruginibacter sp.]